MSTQSEGRTTRPAFIATILALMSLVFAASSAADNATLAGDETLTSAPGKKLIIELEGNPTTGYKWQYQLSPASENIIKIAGCDWVEKSGADDKRRGRSKIYRCRISAVKAGEAQITFTYRRPWEKTKPPKKTRTYDIKIN